jgi:hypothetical protein
MLLPVFLLASPSSCDVSATLRLLPRSNILVLGRTSTGKSTLVNALLGSDIRETTTGLPSFEAFGRAAVPGMAASFYDGPGLETDTFDVQLGEIESRLRRANASFAAEDHFDAVLMVISKTAKWENADLKLALKVVREWGFPLAIVFSRFEGELGDYDVDPKADAADKLAIAVADDLSRNNVTGVELYRVNSARTMRGSHVVFPVAGLERLARGLRGLVDVGVARTRERIEVNRKKERRQDAVAAVGEAARGCRARCNAVVVSPLCLRSENRRMALAMIGRLLQLFAVDGAPAAGALFNAYQEGLVPRGDRHRDVGRLPRGRRRLPVADGEARDGRAGAAGEARGHRSGAAQRGRDRGHPGSSGGTDK